jgi:Holliday junction resolvasome RuvABC endonuclease subunit
MGLDISTTTIGIAIVKEKDDGKLKLVHHEYYKPEKKFGQLEMLSKAQRYITDLVFDLDVNEVAIEQYAQFMKGKSSAKTIIPLAILNTAIQLNIWQATDSGLVPRVMNVLAIRHAIKPTKKLPKKEEMPDIVAKRLGIKFPWEMKVNRRTKKKEKREENWDVADAIAVALAHIAKPSSGPKKVRSKKRRKKNG